MIELARYSTIVDVASAIIAVIVVGLLRGYVKLIERVARLEAKAEQRANDSVDNFVDSGL